MYKIEINRSNVLNTKYGRVKINNKGYYQITTGKDGNHKKFLHRLIWEDNYGSISKGYHVHHKDGDKLNNCISNLELLSGFEHISLHMKGVNHLGENNPMFNSCIKIRKQKHKKCKQGYVWRAQPYTNDKQITISSTDINKCIKKVQEFIDSPENTYGYTSYEIIK